MSISTSSIADSQLVSLDDTDCYASAWADAVEAAKSSGSLKNTWGGRGKGGRALSRRTIQPHTIVVDDVRLEFVSNKGLPGKLLLEGTTLKLLSKRVYALVARNGFGKSTLLRRINAGKIPGFPTHLSSMYISQEVLLDHEETPVEFVLGNHDTYFQTSATKAKCKIEDLEAELEGLDVGSSEACAEKMQMLCEEISQLEEEVEEGYDVQLARQQAQDSLMFFGVDENVWNKPMRLLSGGQRKKVQLATALFCKVDLLLLDEPTNFLDVAGLVQLRRLIDLCVEQNTSVLLVSHDVDLINDVATEVINITDHSLVYYPGNYSDFLGYRQQKNLHRLREHVALEKKRGAMLQTLDHLKKQPTPKRGGAKKGRAIESVKKKLEKQGIQHDDKGHRWKQQKAGTGIREGSINAVDASTRSKMSHSELLKRVETNIAPVPDKAVQFVFRNTTSTWGEPPIVATDLGHGYGANSECSTMELGGPSSSLIVRKPGFLFDCVDLCINEGSTTCILGANASGKSTLLRLLAMAEQPTEGKVYHVQGLSIGYFDQHAVDEILETGMDEKIISNALTVLGKRFPSKTEQDLRGELTSFGVSPDRAVADIRFLSGGERCRVCLAALMLSDPQVLILDEPSSHLDVESVEALIYGLKGWNGTTVIVSHDAHLIRSLGGSCYVIMPHEGKMRRVPNVDAYLKTFTL